MNSLKALNQYLISEGFLKEASMLYSFHKTAISFEGAKQSLESNKVTKKIKNYIVEKHMPTQPPEVSYQEFASAPDTIKEIERYRNTIKHALINMIPRDIEESDKGLSLLWLIKILLIDSNTLLERLGYLSFQMARNKVTDNLEIYFHYKDLMSERDLFRISSIDQLNSIVQNAQSAITEYQNKQVNLDVEAGTEHIYEDDDWKITAAHNKGAACEIGKGTGWCTAAPGLDYFDEYYKPNSPLFNFVDKRTGEKFQFSYHTQQFMDSKDNEVSSDKFEELNEMLIWVADISKKYPSIYFRYRDTPDVEELLNIMNEDIDYGLDNVIAIIENNHNISDKMLDKLSKDSRFPVQIRESIAKNPKSSAKTLDDLAKREDSDLSNIWFNVAKNPSSTSETLAFLLPKLSLSAKTWLAMQSTTSPQKLIELAKDPSSIVRARVANHRYVTDKILEMLSEDSDKDVRRIVENHYIAEEY